MELLTDYSFVAVKQEAYEIKDEIKIESEFIINDDESSGNSFNESEYEVNLEASGVKNITVDKNLVLFEKIDADFSDIKYNESKNFRIGKLEGRLIKKKKSCGYSKRGQKAVTMNYCQESSHFSCNVCAKTYTLNSNLVRHKKQAHSATQKVFKCKECDNTYKRIDYLKDHKILVHQVTHKAFNCNECGETCKHLEYNRDYKKINKKIIECNLCNFVCCNKNKLSRHIAYKHVNHQRKDFVCETCKKLFSSVYHLKDHQLRHRRNLTKNSMNYFICDICNKNFSSKKDITDHIKMHIGMKDYVCLICKRAFTTKSHLLRHERSKFHKNRSNSKKKIK